jgi:integrase
VREALGAIDKGTHVNPDKITLAEYFNEIWLPQLRASSRKRTTVGLYERVAQRYVVDRLGSVRLQTLSKAAVNDLYLDLRVRGRVNPKHPGGLGEAAVRTVQAVLHQAMGDAVALQLMTRNPCDGLPRQPGLPRRQMITWTAEEARVFLDATRETRMGLVWRTLVLTGLRRGEVCGLRWRDVDLEAGRAHVQQALAVVGRELLVQSPKTSSSRRTIS